MTRVSLNIEIFWICKGEGLLSYALDPHTSECYGLEVVIHDASISKAFSCRLKPLFVV